MINVGPTVGEVAAEAEAEGKSTEVERLTEEELREAFGRGLAVLAGDSMLNYEVGQLLKVGTFGAKFCAVDKANKGQVVITVFGKQLLAEAGEAERAIREVGYMRQFNEAHTRYFEDEMFFFSVEPYSEVPTLKVLLRERRRLKEEPLRYIVFDVLKELKRLHGSGLVHLNLSPSAIGLDQQGKVFLRKLRFVHQFVNRPPDEDFEWIQERRGNWVYQAPELSFGQLPDPASDFYSLGVLCFFVLIGSLPEIPKTHAEYVDWLETEPLKIKKNQIPEGCSLECVDFVNRLLVREKSLRLGTFGGINELKSHSFLAGHNKKYKEQLNDEQSPLLCSIECEEESEQESEDEAPETAESTARQLPQDKLLTFFETVKETDVETRLYFDSKIHVFNN